MAGACVYCGAPALVTGPSGVCPQCRETLPVKKIKLGKPAGKGVKAPAFRFGAGASLLAAQAAQTETRAATTTTTAGPSLFQKTAVATEEDPLAAYGAGAPPQPPAAEHDAFSPSVDPNPPPPLGEPTPKTSPVAEVEPAATGAADVVATAPAPVVTEETPPAPLPMATPEADFQPQPPVTEASPPQVFSTEEEPPSPISFAPPSGEDDPMAGFSTPPPPSPETPPSVQPEAPPSQGFEDPMADFSAPAAPATTDPMAGFQPSPPAAEEVFEPAPSPHPEFEDFGPPPAAEHTPPATALHDPMAVYREYWETHQAQTQTPAETPTPEPAPEFYEPVAETLVPVPIAAEIPEPETITPPASEAPSSNFLPSSTYDPMEAYRAYWEQNQGTATAVSPEEPPAQIPPEPEQAPPATSWETPPEESPVFEPPLAPLPEEPAFEAALAEPTPPTEPLVEPPVASLPPPPEEGKAEETPAPTPSTTWFEHHTDTPQAAEAAVPPAPLPQTVSTEEPALFQEELPTPQQAPSALSQTLPALGLSLLVATATGVFLAMGWISALAGGLLGTAALLFLRRSAPPALCLAPVLWASAATLFGTLAAGRGPWLTLPFPLPLSGTPATAAHLLLGLLVLPVVLCWLVAKNLRNTEKIDVLPMPGKLGILTGILGLVLAMAVFALGLKPVFAPKADAEVLTAACRGQVALLSLLPSKGLPLPPVRANLQATLIPPFMPPAAPGEVTSASILVSAPTVSPDQLQCEYLCTSPKICRLSQLSLPSPMADMALFAISAPSAPAMPVPVPTPVSPSSTLSASGQTPAMMQFPALTDAALPIVAECTAVMEAFGHETAAKGKKCDEITTNTRWSGWLQGYGRANCPSLTLSQPQDGPCVLEAKGRSNAGKVCVIRAQAGEKPSVTCQ